MRRTKKQQQSTECRNGEPGEEMAATGVLSDDILLNIMARFPTRALLSRLVLVCRRWHRLLKSHPIKELVPPPLCPYDHPWGSLSEKDILELWYSNRNCLEKVSLNGLNLEIKHVIPLIISCPNLKDLSIVSCPLLSSHDLESIANILPNHLVSLDFHVDSHFHWKVPALYDSVLDTVSHRCPHIQNLDLDSCITVSRDCLFRFLDLKMFIKSLDLYSDAVGWPELANIFVSLEHLEHLSIVSSNLNEPLDDSDDEDNLLNRRMIRSRRQLKNRENSYLSGLEPYSTSIPSRLSSLRLYYSPHHSVSFSSAPSSTLLKHLGHQLHHLHAQNAYNSGWHMISVWCASLETIDLSCARNKDLPFTGIEEVILCGLPRLLKNLKRVALPFAFDGVLVELGRFCPKLKELRLEGFNCTNSQTRVEHPVTDIGVIAIAEGCSELEVLNLSGCRKVTDSAVRALAVQCRKLKILHLASCKNLTDLGVIFLLHQLNSSLCLLDLTGCKNITKGVITSFSLLAKDQGSTIRVLAISRHLWKSSQAKLMKLKIYAPYLSVTSSCKIPWDGFYHSPAWQL